MASPSPIAHTSSSAGPRVALVNLRSGGRRAAEDVLRRLSDTLGADRVWVLFESVNAESHRAELEVFLREQAPQHVIVAGGDGTISFVMDVIKRLQDQRLLSPSRGVIAPFPLGTGNDLSITLGFGSGFARWVVLGGRRFRRLMRTYDTASTTKVDRWLLSVATTSAQHPGGLAHEYVLNNYFSVGFDAAVASRLNGFRGRHPHLFTTRPVVKLWYAVFAVMALFTEEKIGSAVSLDIDGRRVRVPASAKSVAVCNMLTYAGGAVAWNAAAADHYARPSVCDGCVEVVCFYGIWHLALVRLGWSYGVKLGQGSSVHLETGPLSCQFDGEEVLNVTDTGGRSTFHVSRFSHSECLTVPPRQETNAFLVLFVLAAVALLLVLWLSPSLVIEK
ncbi:diacylglycerol kinase-like protein [Novymonas esmeraldas]|uniref:Diacylglycerol kinase n=1 Tax=Novymonas esmeraldas TaxID=1808958 RepID=A0AAW0EZE6_9TRYP